MYSLHTCTLVGVKGVMCMSNYKCTFQSVIFSKKKFLQKVTNFMLNPSFGKDITLSKSYFKIVNKSLKVSLRMVIYTVEFASELWCRIIVEFYVAKLLIRCRNFESNVDRIRVPTEFRQLQNFSYLNKYSKSKII